MAEEQSQEEYLKAQKANCIFCKIASDEVQSKKVFEDEQMLAILDINPATKGHTLVLTKEHYPIMPLIPPQEFDHLFGTAAALSKAVREGALAQRCTIFIANGAIAGQQSPHFLFHLIPRETGDGLEVLEIPKRGINQSDITSMLSQNLYAVMRQHLTKTGKTSLLQIGTPAASAPATQGNAVPASQPPARMSAHEKAERAVPSMQRPDFNQLARTIEENPELRTMIMEHPDKLKKIIDENPQLRSLFEGVDLFALSEQLRKIAAQQRAEPATQEPAAANETHPASSRPANRRHADENQESDEVKPAVEMTLPELFAFIDSKPKLRQFLLEAPQKLKELIPENKPLRRFFHGANIDGILLSFPEHVKHHAAHVSKPRQNETDQDDELLADKTGHDVLRPATEMTMSELFDFIDLKPRLRHLIVEDPDHLKAHIKENERLQKFFKGSNVDSIIQAYQEHAKEKFGVMITMEPEEKGKELKLIKPKGPGRDEEEDAWEEVRWPKGANLDKISRLFR
jgi:histidine triad (HIT) family protein